MGVTVAVTRTVCTVDTPPYDQSITTADLGGLTPKAVFLIVSQATVDGTSADHAIIGIGAATSSTQRWGLSVGSEDNLASADAFRRAAIDECVIKVLTTSSAVDGEADFKEFIANGCTITWGNAPASAFFITAVFFAGTDLSAKADVKALAAAQDATLNVEDVGFEPDVLLTGVYGIDFDDATHNNLIFSQGVVINKPSVIQCCAGMSDDDGAATMAPTGYITDSYGAMQIFNGAITWGGEFSDFDALGFSVTTRLAGSGGDDFGFLALYFNGTVDFWAGIIDTPTSTGDQAYAGPGFTPQYVHMAVTQMPAIDTVYTDSNAGCMGISTFDDDDEYCTSIQVQDNVATSNTKSLSDNTAVNLPDDDGTAAHVAAFKSFDANGWTLTYSATEGTAVKQWALAIETEAARIPRHPAAYNALFIY